MPESPSWAARLPEIEAQIRNQPWIAPPQLAGILGVSIRRAQQIFAPCKFKSNSPVAVCETVIERLRSLCGKSDPSQEIARRRKLADTLQTKEKPLFVSAPTKIMEQRFEVPGVTVAPGEIRVSFSNPMEARERLLALAMAMANQPDEFEYLATKGEK